MRFVLIVVPSRFLRGTWKRQLQLNFRTRGQGGRAIRSSRTATRPDW